MKKFWFLPTGKESLRLGHLPQEEKKGKKGKGRKEVRRGFSSTIFQVLT